MVDGKSGKSDRIDGLDAKDMAGVAPENRVHVARLRSMPREELHKIGQEECEERRWQASLDEIP